jgi:hypothetical protein
LDKDKSIAIELDSNTVKQAMMRMKNRRAAGPGDIPIELIKNGGHKLPEMITILVNKIINGQKVPEEWKFAVIISIHKKGDNRKCDSYREISVTSTFSRIYGRIICFLLHDCHSVFITAVALRLLAHTHGSL